MEMILIKVLVSAIHDQCVNYILPSLHYPDEVVINLNCDCSKRREQLTNNHKIKKSKFPKAKKILSIHAKGFL